MAINPLQLPRWADVPQLDWSPLAKIGDALARERQRQAMAEAAARHTTEGQTNYAGLAGEFARSGDLEQAAKVAGVGKALNSEDSTDEIKEYRLAQKQGEKRTFSDWKTGLKQAGATRINNVINSGEKAYDTELGKDYAKNFIETMKSGRTAQSAVGTLNLMERLTHDPNFYSGTGGQAVTAAKRAAAALGFREKDVASPNELFSAMGNRLVLDASGGSLGTGFSNADRDFLTSTVPTLQNTPEGNRSIIGMQRKVYERQLQVAELARRYVRENGRMDAGFDGVLSRWAEANPVFPRATPAPGPAQPQPRPQGAPAPQQPATPQGGGAPVRVRSVEEARALAPGTRFITPDGRVKVR